MSVQLQIQSKRTTACCKFCGYRTNQVGGLRVTYYAYSDTESIHLNCLLNSLIMNYAGNENVSKNQKEDLKAFGRLLRKHFR